ncbi:ABC transporter substrate-binding protein [Chitinibacter sp. SCUT-21]|uniref:ABC transporter substrate-binding protein n=1 Tax=Chitinibacter sp. SCUT-21 TaxID=2970891 RepID=UPI0035A654B7
MRCRLQLLLGLYFILLSIASAAAATVAFINPGKHNELYWSTASSAMQDAAKQLGFSLEISYAQRDPLRAIEIARLIAARPAQNQPDYIIFSNDHGTGPEILKILAKTRSKTFLAFSTMATPQEREQTQGPRQKYPNWIGSLVPDAEQAGYLSAKQLLTAARQAQLYGPDRRLQVIAIAGDRSTPSSVLRNQGLQRAIAESPDAVLKQMVYAKWQQEKAAEQSRWLFARYPEARLVWSGSDMMAFGAMQSWEQAGGQVGKTAVFSAINTSPAAMAAIQNGRLSALAGGHHMNGAFALVMIYDYSHGLDFARESIELEAPMFGLISPQMAAKYQKKYGFHDFSQINFKAYSKYENPKNQKYVFTLASWLR